MQISIQNSKLPLDTKRKSFERFQTQSRIQYILFHHLSRGLLHRALNCFSLLLPYENIPMKRRPSTADAPAAPASRVQHPTEEEAPPLSLSVASSLVVPEADDIIIFVLLTYSCTDCMICSTRSAQNCAQNRTGHQNQYRYITTVVVTTDTTVRSRLFWSSVEYDYEYLENNRAGTQKKLTIEKTKGWK